MGRTLHHAFATTLQQNNEFIHFFFLFSALLLAPLVDSMPGHAPLFTALTSRGW
jgi:hypothetical protein